MIDPKIDTDLNRQETEEMIETGTDAFKDVETHQEIQRIQITNDLITETIVEDHKIAVATNRKKDDRTIYNHRIHLHHQ